MTFVPLNKLLATLPKGLDKPKVPKEEIEDPNLKEKTKHHFLTVYASTALVKEAAFLSGVTEACINRWRYEDEEFAKNWDDITMNKIVPVLEAEATRRALNGSDMLLAFLLKSYRPNVYNPELTRKDQDNLKKLEIKIVDAAGNSLISPKLPEKTEKDVTPK
jgi:hypothetical protein